MGQYKTLTHPKLLNELAVEFSNTELIAERAVPPTNVDAQDFTYPKFTMREAFQTTDSEVAPTGKPNSRFFSAEMVTGSVQGYALDTEFPIADKDDESRIAANEQRSVRFLGADLKLGRERRMAELLFDPSNYGSDNKVTLATPWTDTTGSNPVANFQTAIAACLMKPNKAIFGNAAWDAFRRHPDIIALLRGTSGSTRGLATLEEVAGYFELDEILVGKARYDSTFVKSTPTLIRAWDDSKCLIGRILDAPTDDDVTLARHYRYKPEGEAGVEVHMEIDNKKGTKGVVYVKVSALEKTQMIESSVGFLMSGCV